MAKDQKSDKDAKHDKGAKGAPKDAGKDAKPAPARPAEGKPAKEPKGKDKPAKPTAKEAAPTQPPRLAVQYREKIVPTLMKQFGYKTVMQVPRVTKITLNMGVGEAGADKKILEHAAGDMQKIPGQKPVITKSKKSVRARLRRPRQLQHGHQGTDHLPGDRVRQDRRAPGHEHLHHHHREDGRRGEGASRRIQVPLQD